MEGDEAEIRRRLEEERYRLIYGLEQSEGAVVEVDRPGYGNHMADDASEVFEQTKTAALRQNLERVLQQVEHALHKLEVGSYGICDQCQEAIGAARLEALPYAALCLSCEQHREAKGFAAGS
ncbi:MAG: TraR/DksA family transcriptional regulator [Anaerolineae bacterium]